MNNLLKKLNLDDISPFFDECYEKIADDTSIPYWLTEEFLTETIIKKYDFLPENKEAIIVSLRELVKNPDLVQFEKVLYEMGKVTSDGVEIRKSMKYPELPGSSMTGAFSVLAHYPGAYEEQKAAGADEKILLDTFRMLDVYETDTVSSHGTVKFSPVGFWWTSLAKNKLIFRVGRLNFERLINSRLGVYGFVNNAGETTLLMDSGVPISADGQYAHSNPDFLTEFTETDEYWEGFAPDNATATVKNEKTKLSKKEWRIFYKPGDDALSVHIPRLGSFDPEVIESAMTKCREFLKKNFPDFCPTAYFCESWLLAPELHDFLKPDSNILDFNKRFFKYPSEAYCGKDVFTYIYQMPVPETLDGYDFSVLPENSSLQKKVKDHYMSGKTVHEVNGLYPY